MLFDLALPVLNLIVSAMKSLFIATLLAAVIPLTACSKDFDNSTVKEFDLSRYLGVWYEIARYDHSFERGMDNTMAQYILQDDGTVVVLNTGWKNGKFKLAEGKAKYKDPEGDPGHLRVSFFLFFFAWCWMRLNNEDTTPLSLSGLTRAVISRRNNAQCNCQNGNREQEVLFPSVNEYSYAGDNAFAYRFRKSD